MILNNNNNNNKKVMQQITWCKIHYFEFTTYIKNELHLLMLIQSF